MAVLLSGVPNEITPILLCFTESPLHVLPTMIAESELDFNNSPANSALSHRKRLAGGPYSAYAMLRPWDTTSLHSSFGTVNGLQIGDGDIGPVLDSLDGFIRGAEVWFDVTDYLEGVRAGATDHGIAIQANGTSDGWQIHTNGSTTPDARPRLVVYSADLGLEGAPGD